MRDERDSSEAMDRRPEPLEKRDRHGSPANDSSVMAWFRAFLARMLASDKSTTEPNRKQRRRLSRKSRAAASRQNPSRPYGNIRRVLKHQRTWAGMR